MYTTKHYFKMANLLVQFVYDGSFNADQLEHAIKVISKHFLEDNPRFKEHLFRKEITRLLG